MTSAFKGLYVYQTKDMTSIAVMGDLNSLSQNLLHIHSSNTVNISIVVMLGNKMVQWLRHCPTRQKVASSIPDVIGIIHWHNPSNCTMAQGSTHPITEMSTRNISWGGKCGRCVRLTILPPSCANCLEIGSFNLLEPSGPVQACNGFALPLTVLGFDCAY